MKKYKCTICKYEYDPAQGDTSGISPFNTGSALYNYEEKLNSDGWTFKDNPRFGRLTFTIVEEHYMVASR